MTELPRALVNAGDINQVKIIKFCYLLLGGRYTSWWLYSPHRPGEACNCLGQGKLGPGQGRGQKVPGSTLHSERFWGTNNNKVLLFKGRKSLDKAFKGVVACAVLPRASVPAHAQLDGNRDEALGRESTDR